MISSVFQLLAIWFSFYLADLVSTSIDDISKSLGIYCFSIERRPGAEYEPSTPQKLKGRRIRSRPSVDGKTD